MHCAVAMADGSVKTVADIRPGDLVRTAGADAKGRVPAADASPTDTPYPSARVRLVVQYNSPVRVCTLRGGYRHPAAGDAPAPGPTLTLWHPVAVPSAPGAAAAWRFPAHLQHSRPEAVAACVRTFVLDSGHTMLIDGVACCTLARAHAAPNAAPAPSPLPAFNFLPQRRPSPAPPALSCRLLSPLSLAASRLVILPLSDRSSAPPPPLQHTPTAGARIHRARGGAFLLRHPHGCRRPCEVPGGRLGARAAPL